MSQMRTALMIFPPNWTACVYGPHLAMPLLAGAARNTDWKIETWDLSEEFYRTFAKPPSRNDVVTGSDNEKFEVLDELYFAWEDQLRSLPSTENDSADFGLLSGYSFRRFRKLPLAETARLINEGTVYTSYLKKHVLPRLLEVQPSVVGVTIASQEQIIPALEILQLVRATLPESFVVLGGNVVTRLRETSAFKTLSSLADQTVVYQGDLAFTRVLEAVGALGVDGARKALPRVVSEQQISYEQWPVPSFAGIDFSQIVGVPVLPYVSTRGCYWGKCHFCAIPAGWSSKGYGGSAPADFVANQLLRMFNETGIPRVKFVDEAFPPSKARPLADRLCELGVTIEWEAYARLEPAWEDLELLEAARRGGLRKLYFGLEQAPTASRAVFGKNDRGNPMRILEMCDRVGIKVHLFCMVGHPGTSRDDAKATVQYLLDNQHLINAADLVAFRHDRGTSVPGVRAIQNSQSDWIMALDYEPTQAGVLMPREVDELEHECQEILWENCPRLLHPLYRIVGNWETARTIPKSTPLPDAGHLCLASSCSTV